MIIVTANQKGGVGKSTIAVHLVFWLREHGIDTALVDADMQNSSSLWAKSIDPKLPVYRYQEYEKIYEAKNLQKKHAMIVIDAPGGLGEATRAAFMVAHLALIPCGPSVLDLRSAHEVVRVLNSVKGFRKNMPYAVFVPNRVQGRYRLSKELLDTAAQLGFDDISSPLGLRQAYADAPGQNTLVWKMGAGAKAASDEMLKLCEKIWSELYHAKAAING